MNKIVIVINIATSMLILSGFARAFLADLVEIVNTDDVEEDTEVITSNDESEKKFIKRYVNKDGVAFFGWREIFHAESGELKKFCINAHKAAGLGKVDVEDGFEGYGLLKFKNKSIQPATISLLTYVIDTPEDKEQKDDNHDPHHDHYRHTDDMNQVIAPFQHVMHGKTSVESPNPSYKNRIYYFITKGTQDDCVFYLDQVDKDYYTKEFQLEDEVCGIPAMKLEFGH